MTVSEIQVVTNGYFVRYPESNDLRLLTFSYLPGCDLFHKIALTSKSIRQLMPNSGLLDQVIVISLKTPKDATLCPDYLPPKSFKYALSLADSIQV